MLTFPPPSLNHSNSLGQWQLKNPTHFEKLGTVLFAQFVVEHCDGFPQVPPLSGYLPLSLLQLFQLLLSFSSQSLQVPALLLVQETMEVLKLGPDFSFQGIETALKMRQWVI